MKKLKPQSKPAISPAPEAQPQKPATGSSAGLPLFLRAKAEASLGRPLDDVRVHTGAEAAQSADGVGARAYTTGHDIVFGAGQYNPHTPEGQRLVGHELAHVVQQSSGASAGAAPNDHLERTASEAGGKIASGAPAAVAPVAGAPAIQRETVSDAKPPHLKAPPMLAHAMGSGTVDGFVTGSAALSPSQKAHIAALAVSIVSLRDDYPSCSVSVTGHTDAVGAEAFNDVLGQGRAESVKQELAANGVPPEIILTASAGSHQLKVKTNAAEARNRRAEIQFEPESRIHVLPGLLELPKSPITPAPPKDLPPPLAPRRDVLEPTVPFVIPPAPGPLPTPKTAPSKPLLDSVDKALDSVLERLHVPPLVRPLVKSGAKAAATQAVMAPLNAAMDHAGLNSNEKDAVRTAVSVTVGIVWP